MLNVSHPGRYGDLFWALPSIRMLARQHGPVTLHLPVDPANTTPMSKVKNLLEKQVDYIDRVVIREDWSIELEAPRRPFAPPDSEGLWYHLAYREWPPMPLPYYSAVLADLDPSAVDWSPWITAQPLTPFDVLFHWTDRWFELKHGLTLLLTERGSFSWRQRYGPNSRWEKETSDGSPALFEHMARVIASCRLVVTDCSCIHVLAAALGKPVVVVEPEEARHHPVFWPGSRQDEQGHWKQAGTHFGGLIFPVIGGDGKPTFDARHTADLIKERLRHA